MFQTGYLAPSGSTGNVTTASYPVDDYETLAVQFVVEAVGATPTVSWKVQGSLDGANWYDLFFITDGTDGGTSAVLTATGVGAQVIYASNPVGRKYKFFRLVTTSNTNVTFRAEIYKIAS